MSPTAAARPASESPSGLTSSSTSGRTAASILDPSDTFVRRHIGPSDADVQEMLETLGERSLETFTDGVVPESIRLRAEMDLPGASHTRGEHELLAELRQMAGQNQVFRSMLGMGYHDCITPPVILRNVLENPGWYTQYTPYQAEIAQGRLEALLNFQTMVSDLTGLPLAGASLLDESTAAAEAMGMCYGAAGGGFGPERAFFVSSDCHPQTIELLRTRARFLGLDLVVGDVSRIDFGAKSYCGVLVQYPATDGRLVDHRALVERAHDHRALVVFATDLLALTLLTPPGEMGADIAIGSAQRFGVPMGLGGPHAAFIATQLEFTRKLPGRLIGVSRDMQGNPALRMAIQTREQHIRREKATSNICTAQALLAIMAGLYGCYHGPEGLRRIAQRVRAYTCVIAGALRRQGHEVLTEAFFDTIRVRPVRGSAAAVLEAARQRRVNLRDFGDGTVGISCDETTSREDVLLVLAAFGGTAEKPSDVDAMLAEADLSLPAAFSRQSGYLTHPVFNAHHSETEMLRYIFRLQSRDLSLAHSMIPLGSCTMKLNATSEMIPVTWPEFGRIHPFAPADQWRGYQQMFTRLEKWLAEITGFAAVSLQPNAGAQGEYTGLLAIRAFHDARGEGHRDVCLIPTSAHGTNPASAVIAGLRVVPVRCDDQGNVDITDLKAKAGEHAAKLSALMVTYPSTHGVFEEGIREICRIVHEHGGQVYMDGANMNAQVGLCRPGDIGADVCHLNLHKTFCIPHGGGGPGMGPICVAAHLAPFLPGHPVSRVQFAGGAGAQAIGNVSAAPYGSASILPISYVYIGLMGSQGLRRATQVAILNANYMAARLRGHYDVLYTGKNGRVAHEFILDFRAFEESADIRVEDVAKRLQDYGFHGPTMSWPVAGTLMIEPTESEPKEELDRLCDSLIGIREEIRAIEEGRLPRDDNPLKNAPHTHGVVTAAEWGHAYSREEAAFPSRAKWLRGPNGFKFWPAVGRVDNPYGDRNLVCTCPPMESFAGAGG
ncbi:MAG: aminomethyl-transferring glycine dehydrogenase [Planctomycetota bacterium]|nr:aminomethyl-transferring glycine dehydrogenase [Planctomycetota bacterium]